MCPGSNNNFYRPLVPAYLGRLVCANGKARLVCANGKARLVCANGKAEYGKIGRMDADDLLTALDPEQREVALATRGPVCVLAGAGTGKTRACLLYTSPSPRD